MAKYGGFKYGAEQYRADTQMLITDRTGADVARVKALRDKIIARGWDGLSESERGEWLSEMRGVYAHTDLNRVGKFVDYLASELNTYGYAITVAPKTDWGVEDIPRAAQMAAYLADVTTIKDRFYGQTPLPEAMEGLTHIGANNIEILLLEAYGYIQLMKRGFRKCGTFKCGQGVILS